MCQGGMGVRVDGMVQFVCDLNMLMVEWCGLRLFFLGGSMS